MHSPDQEMTSWLQVRTKASRTLQNSFSTSAYAVHSFFVPSHLCSPSHMDLVCGNSTPAYFVMSTAQTSSSPPAFCDQVFPFYPNQEAKFPSCIIMFLLIYKEGIVCSPHFSRHRHSGSAVQTEFSGILSPHWILLVGTKWWGKDNHILCVYSYFVWGLGLPGKICQFHLAKKHGAGFVYLVGWFLFVSLVCPKYFMGYT